MIALYKRKN